MKRNLVAERSWLRWVVMLSMSLVVFGGYYVYDAISPLRAAMEAELGMGPSDFGWLVSFYSIPNVLGITILGGILMDRRGVPFAGFWFTVLCVLGAVLTALGASDLFRQSAVRDSLTGLVPGWSGELLVMVSGRLLFGFGAEVLIVAQNKVIARWFRDRELALAFGLNLMVCRLGTIAAFNVTSRIVEVNKTFELIPRESGMWTFATGYPGLSTALWISAAVMLGSFLMFFVYMALDHERPLARKQVPRFSPADLGKLLTNRTFLYVAFLCAFFYSAIFPFTSFAPDILQNKFGLSSGMAGALPSLVMSATIVGTPLCGYFVDRRGRRATLMIFGSFLLMSAHLLLAMTGLHPLFSMIVLGLSFSLVPAAMWPSVPLLVPEHQLGTAYGIMSTLQNAGFWGVPILIGKLTEWANPGVSAQMVQQGRATWDYAPALFLLAFLGSLGLVFSLLLKGAQGRHAAGGLERPSKRFDT